MLKTISHIYAALFLIFVLTGCVNLDAVRKFSAESSDQKQYQSLVDGYAEFPVRLRRYRPASDYDSLDDRYEERKVKRDELMALHTVLSDYMGAIGTLASDELVNYDGEIKGLGSALQDVELINASEAASFNSIAQIISRAATDAYRQKKLGEILREADPHVSAVTSTLADIIGKTLIIDIEIERQEIYRYFRPVLGTEDSPVTLDTPELIAADQIRKDLLAQLDARTEAAMQYAKVIDSIGQAHHRLAIESSELNTARALGIAAAYADDIFRAKQTIDQLLERAE